MGVAEDSREPSSLRAVEEEGKEPGLRPTDPQESIDSVQPLRAVVELVSAPELSTRVEADGRSDTELVEEFLEGSRPSFEVLVQRHQDRVFRICVRLLDSRSLAEEAAQEVFVKVFRNLDRFRGDSLFTTWLTRIALNHCRNVQSYRTRRKQRSHVSLDAPRAMDDGSEIPRQLASRAPTAEDSLVREERLRIVEKELGRLDPLWQEILVLRDVEGMAYEQISEALDLSPGTVKSRLHRARNELKKRVQRYLLSNNLSKGAGQSRTRDDE
ncbi:MAG: hypothetical protein CL928_00575 [Deltaproteobacteria bacterium]|nr:hypothetical protein [Deltaproteobacteria bacterium]